MIWGWAIFALTIIVMLALDLGVFNKNSHKINFNEAMRWTCVWVGLSVLFGAGIYFYMSPAKALEFATAYLIEKSLSLDNIFVFLLIFNYFKVEQIHQHKILFYGVIGALVLRALMLMLGLALITTFHWVIYIFGLILIYSAVRMLTADNFSIQLAQSPFLLWLEQYFPFTKENHGSRLWVKQGRRLMATPLFLVLLTIEFADLIFAIDSIPAVLAISYDPFIVYTSNVFAILGLRSMFFLLADVMPRFRFIHHGLSAILAFVGAKMLLSPYYTIPTTISLVVIISILVFSVVFSVLVKKSD